MCWATWANRFLSAALPRSVARLLLTNQGVRRGVKLIPNRRIVTLKRRLSWESQPPLDDGLGEWAGSPRIDSHVGRKLPVDASSWGPGRARRVRAP